MACPIPYGGHYNVRLLIATIPPLTRSTSNSTTQSFRATSHVCLSCLFVTLVYCGHWLNGWMDQEFKIGTEVGKKHCPRGQC